MVVDELKCILVLQEPLNDQEIKRTFRHFFARKLPYGYLLISRRRFSFQVAKKFESSTGLFTSKITELDISSVSFVALQPRHESEENLIKTKV